MTSSSSHSLSGATLATQSQSRLSNSSMLWAHLQRKDTTLPPSSASALPPLAPLDKTSTSLRILLHDTQSHFETFSDRVQGLTKGVEEAKREMALIKTLFEKEHEDMTNEMFSLANRCQIEIIKAIGEPVQTSAFSDLQKDMRYRLDGLDKRIDSIQMLHQSNSQILNTQTQAIHTIQEQHNAILTTLGPLLPLLQAVPLHIENACNSLKESLLKTLETVKTQPAPVVDITLPSKTPTDPPTKSPFSARKRKRDENAKETISSPNDRGCPAQKSTPHIFSTLSKRRSLLDSTSRAPATAPAQSLFGIRMLVDPKTPRRPLADLPLTGNLAMNSARRMSFKNRRGSSVFAHTPNSSRITQLPVCPVEPSSKPIATPMLVQHASTPPTRLTESQNARVQQDSSSVQPLIRAPRPPSLVTLPRSMNGSALRQMRSPFREGRRFIPLDDSDDSDVGAPAPDN